MSYHELCLWAKRKADTSPRILNLLLDHALGKPPEHIQQEGVIFIMSAKKDNDTQDAEVVDDGQKFLPEGEEE
jgi:hypothetical protein